MNDNEILSCGRDGECPIYCIRCGRLLHSTEVFYSTDDPDCEESMCRKCYEQYEKSLESEE